MSEPTATAAVFLSYAREDTDAARRIAEALRAFGVEAWFDQSELRGGDAWDQKIRGQIRACMLFLPIISARTQSRHEGYFRREWKLAVERTHDMAAGVAFIVPVVIDETPESEAAVPDEFMRVQWTRLPHGVPTPQFVDQIKRLLESPRKAAAATRPAFPIAGPAPAPATAAAVPRPSGFPFWLVAALGVAVLGAVAYIALRPAAQQVADAKPAAPSPSASSVAPAAPKVADKSIAVLPFANLSTEKQNEFFADGVQDDVITNLAKIRDLTVISRTSTLAYRDPVTRSNLKKIAAELNVATILEGSVARVGTKVHMNAQLIDARTDAHLWADTFDGDASDIFALQASLAQKIAAALKATLTPGERTLIERRPTENQDAYELYLRASLLEQALNTNAGRESYLPIIALHEQAIAKDPTFALAFARLSGVHGKMFWFGQVDPTPERRALAQTALESARRLAPDAPETHVTLGQFAYFCDNDWKAALAEFARAEPGLPNDSSLQYQIGIAQRRLGQWTEALRRFERAAALNPHDLNSINTHVETLFALRRFVEARTFAARYLEIFPADRVLRSFLVRAQYALDGDRAACARGLAALAAGDLDPLGTQYGYVAALIAGDLAAAERTLADPRQGTMRGLGNAIVEPAALRRASVAFLRGQKEAAGKFADEAIEYYRDRAWTRRQQPVALLNIAEAEAFAGRADAAVRDGRNAVEQYRAFDGYLVADCELALGGIHLAVGQRDAALEALRRALSSGSNVSPQEIRNNPFWSQLKDDPRFEEILKSAKPL